MKIHKHFKIGEGINIIIFKNCVKKWPTEPTNVIPKNKNIPSSFMKAYHTYISNMIILTIQYCIVPLGL
jgi:hypothetical protein